MTINLPRRVWYSMAALDIVLAFAMEDWRSYLLLIVAAACITSALVGEENEL